MLHITWGNVTSYAALGNSDEGEPRDAAARALATDYGGREKAEPEPEVLLRGKRGNSGTRFGCDPSDDDLLLRGRWTCTSRMQCFGKCLDVVACV